MTYIGPKIEQFFSDLYNKSVTNGSDIIYEQLGWQWYIATVKFFIRVFPKLPTTQS